MKHTINILGAFILLSIFAVSCVDDAIDDFIVEKPESVKEMEYLNDYNVLKSYIDRNANPSFKLGAGVTVSDYLKKDGYYRFINDNFDIMTAGNAMKYASVVDDKGAMNFGSVVQFVNAAKDAGMDIYGHTLLWHAQQNKKYLESLLKDKEFDIDPNATEEVVDGLKDYSVEGFTGWVGGDVPVTPYVENGVLVVENPSAMEQNYFLQYHVAGGIPVKEGVPYKVTVRIKGTVEGSISLGLGTWSSRPSTQLPITTEWVDATVELNMTTTDAGAFVMLQSGLYVGTYEIAWVKVTHEEAMAIKYFENLVSNSDVEGGDVSCFFATELKNGPNAATIGAAGTGSDGVGHAIVVHSGDSPTEEYDSQFFVKAPYVFAEGDVIRFSMDVKAEKAATINSQAQKNPGEYLHWAMVGSPNVTTEWQEHKYSGVIAANQAGMSTIAFNLSVFKEANTYYFDNIVWEIEKSGNTKPLTPEEKADTLTWAMTNWISGMMEATDGYVKEWDVVNEAISGADGDGDGIYDLQSAGNVSEDDAKSNFYWQDYLGEDFTRTAVALARQYGPADIKLFVNDYNLESDWDDNQKLKSLIKWIERWEDDGVTVIDGIGTQMHISYYMNPETQASKEEHVVQMFELMAETGKLIRITELDMGLVNADGDPVKTPDVTLEQHKAMSDYYKFIVQKYFEIIPAGQRAGITQWCLFDSEDKEGNWRRAEPVGLWSLDKRRKHTYAGFADGLADN